MLAGASYDLPEKDIQLTHRCNITSIDAPHKPETLALAARKVKTFNTCIYLQLLL